MKLSQHLPMAQAIVSKNLPQSKPARGGHHDHGWSGTLMHVGHDVAMIGMSLPCCEPQPVAIPPMEICGTGPAAVAAREQAALSHNHAAMGHDHGGHAHHHGGTLNNAMAGISAAVAVGAAVHGVEMLRSDDTLTKLEGANHLLMSASCGVMATQMFTGNAALNGWSAGLMAAHGLGELALGVHQLVKGVNEDCAHHKFLGATKTVHGACLAAAQVFPGAALPLYLAMGAATAAQASMTASH